jgi:hypothetical protein
MGKILDMKTLIALLVSLVTCVFSAGAFANSYKYRDLLIKDYDEMLAQVQSRIKKARAASHPGEEAGDEHETIEQLRDALKLIMSRPNSDNMIAKLTPEVRRELVNYSAFEDTISSLAAEAIANVKDTNATVTQRSTSLFILENLLMEIKPEVGTNEDLTRVVRRIADANLKIDKDVAKERKMNTMFKTKNPSEMAEEMIKGLPKKEEKKK